MTGDLKLFAGNSNPALAQSIAAQLGAPLGALTVGRFSDGEVKVSIDEHVRGADVFLVQSTGWPVNENLMELLIMLDAFRRASAQRITAVIPYFGYARQDRKARGREPITAKLVANLLSTAGADRILTMDLHTPQIQGFFDIPLDHLQAVPILADYFQRHGLGADCVVIAPDAGGGNRARDLAEHLGAPIGFLDKRRTAPGVAEVTNVIGDVKGRDCIIIDDLIDTAGTVTESAQALKERGAHRVYACCTHPVLSGPGIERISHAPMERVVVCDTTPVALTPERLTVLSVAPIMAEAIRRIHENRSVSRLFKNGADDSDTNLRTDRNAAATRQG